MGMTYTVPDHISFTDQDIKKMSKRQSLFPGWYRFAITDATKEVAESGSLMVVTKCTALKSDDTPAKLPVRNNIILPQCNPDVPGHVAPNTAGICVGMLHALFPDEVHTQPRKNKDTGRLEYAGEEIERSEYDEKAEEAMRSMTSKLAEVWDDPAQLVGHTFFGEFGPSKPAKDGQIYNNILVVAAELPDGKELVDDTDFFKDPEAEATPAAKPVTKAATKKGKR